MKSPPALGPSPPRSRTRGQRTATGPMLVMISRLGRCPWRTNRRRPSSVSLSAWQNALRVDRVAAVRAKQNPKLRMPKARARPPAGTLAWGKVGQPSIDPELMIRMLNIGYVCAIRSERALCRDVQVNLAIAVGLWTFHRGLRDQLARSRVPQPTTGGTAGQRVSGASFAGMGPIPRATIPPWNFDACGVEQEPVNATTALPSTATLSREM
jgi:hypothetical protein